MHLFLPNVNNHPSIFRATKSLLMFRSSPGLRYQLPSHNLQQPLKNLEMFLDKNENVESQTLAYLLFPPNSAALKQTKNQ